MAGGDVDFFEGIELFIFLVSNLENLAILTSSQFLKDLVVPQSAVLAHMTLHFILFIIVRT